MNNLIKKINESTSLMEAYLKLNGYALRKDRFDFEYKNICGTVVQRNGNLVLSDSFDIIENDEVVCSVVLRGGKYVAKMDGN